MAIISYTIINYTFISYSFISSYRWHQAEQTQLQWDLIPWVLQHPFSSHSPQFITKPSHPCWSRGHCKFPSLPQGHCQGNGRQGMPSSWHFADPVPLGCNSSRVTVQVSPSPKQGQGLCSEFLELQEAPGPGWMGLLSFVKGISYAETLCTYL